MNIANLLEYCPKGTKLYSTTFGEVTFDRIDMDEKYPILVYKIDGAHTSFDEEGRYVKYYNSECVLFPSKDQRDWSKFTSPWYKKEKFDPKTLKPFDKVLVRDECSERWRCEFYSYLHDDNGDYPYIVINDAYKHCIPYNDDTKHLVGTTKEAPEYYRYWED